MCTAMALVSKNKDIYFGRTMDFSYELNPEVYIVPRNYKWNNTINDYIINNKYKFIGTGQNIGKITFADGVNELGLAGAVLYFPEYANYNYYKKSKQEHISIGSIDLINFILGNCKDINDVIKTINNLKIVGLEDSITHSVAPLHWIFIDKKDNCITVEKTTNGLQIINNQLKVLSNSPNFEWQMANLRNYMNISPFQLESVSWGDISIKPFGQGAGSLGLPGDYTSPSRFVRTAFLKSFIATPANANKGVNACFNIMKSVTIPKGIVTTKRGTDDYTQYTVFMNINNGDYYFNTHSNNQITKANINDCNSNEIVSLGKLNRVINFNTLI